jgi:hypothetical protein
VAHGLPRASCLGNSNPNKIKNLLVACLLKSAHSCGNSSVRDPYDVGAAASNCKTVKTGLIVRTVQFGPAEPFFQSLWWMGRGDKRSQQIPLR